MAHFRPRGNRWRAEIELRGVRRAGSFGSKAAAKAWAGRVEAEILAGETGEIPRHLTVADLLNRYGREVSARKKGARWEQIRIGLLGRDRLAQVRLRKLDSPHVADWQQRRLQAVSEASVRRERNLLNAAFEIARKEWRWLKAKPFEGVRRPRDGRPKERIATPEEIDRLLGAASEQLRRAIVVALETGMRAGEIASRPEIRGAVAYLADTKNGEFREVPLSLKAAEQLRAGVNLSAGSISALFARLCAELRIEGLTFHRLRATAATRLSSRLTVLELCAMFGWKDPRMVLKHYYRADAEATARKL